MPPNTLFVEEDRGLEQDGRIQLETQIPSHYAGQRLDQAAAVLFPQFSRARLQQWIKSGALTMDGRHVKPNYKLAGSEHLKVRAEIEPRGEWLAEPLTLNIVFEDDAIIVVNKPAGLVVHPAPGHYTGTLLNGLLHHHKRLANLPRAGIVHRLDKETTGLMVVAKTDEAQHQLVTQLQARTVKRQYLALVQGAFTGAGTVDEPIGRHPSQRVKMAVLKRGGKEAKTSYQPLEKYVDAISLVQLRLETGRTHQIRVHMAHIGHPLIGDPVYGCRLPAKLLRENPQLQVLANFPRQALHAAQLGLKHPHSGEFCEWEVPVPEDFAALLDGLRC